MLSMHEACIIGITTDTNQKIPRFVTLLCVSIENPEQFHLS